MNEDWRKLSNSFIPDICIKISQKKSRFILCESKSKLYDEKHEEGVLLEIEHMNSP